MAESRLSNIVGYLGPTNDLTNPIWTIHLSPAFSLVCIVLAELLWKSGFAHGVCLGLATGQLFVTCIAAFNIKSVTFKDPNDAIFQQLHLTR
ncbi:MAG: hypothetical protein HIU91_11615 [Acidobacteria bacterium]|nr:hypothetical protein [Acidobacteriota bacterium]